VVFEADYDEIELQNIVMTSFHQFEPPPNQNFWLRQWSWVNDLMVFKKSGLGLEKNWWSWSCNLVVLLHLWYTS